MAMDSPSTVVVSASESPEVSSLVFTEVTEDRASNTCIIPRTVPRRPHSGEMTAITLRQVRLHTRILLLILYTNPVSRRMQSMEKLRFSISLAVTEMNVVLNIPPDLSRDSPVPDLMRLINVP